MATPSPVAIDGLVVVRYTWPVSPCGKERIICKNFFNAICLEVQYIHTITFNVRSGFGNEKTQMVLRDEYQLQNSA
jgi:hypothetical protein